jgi:hypothetical protein
MSEKESSDEMASVAGRIMAIQQQGGPIKFYEAEIREQFSIGEGESIVFGKLQNILGEYFSDAASLAGSVLSQKEPE